MRAKITPGAGAKPGGANVIRDQLKSAFSRGEKTQAAVKLDMSRHIVSIEGDISREQLETALKHTKISYEVSYEEDEASRKEGVKVPGDYYTLKQRVADQREQIQHHKGEISELENRLKNEQLVHEKERAAAQARIENLESRAAQPKGMQDFISETMSREGESWRNFFRLYSEAIKEGSELYDIPDDIFEKGCLEYQALEKRPDYIKLKKSCEEAEKARKMASENPFITLDPEAESILKKMERLNEADKAIKDTRAGLMEYIRKEKPRMTIAISTSGEKTLVILPYEFSGKMLSEYPEIEQDLVGTINGTLEAAGSDYNVDSFNGLLRYTIPGIGKRIRNRLAKAISQGDDAFTKLGGKREVTRLEIL